TEFISVSLRLFALVKVFLKAGAKVQLLFLTGKKFLKFFFGNFYFHLLLFFLSVYQGTLLVLRGANVTSVF
ncbi:hypothetical protein ACM55K_12610, partial [Flavobacterium sp. LT1R49]|uniref:hypothetical protein n=1 Tax=Flavobacterium arabinosi TaxID=3398737 RepID=UPI003A8545D6